MFRMLSPVLVALACSCCVSSDVQPIMEKPVWRVGDSWEVRCPDMGAFRNEVIITGSYRVRVDVLPSETLRGAECHVLRVTRTNFGSFSETVRTEHYAYYRAADYALVRIKKLRWVKGEQHPTTIIHSLPGGEPLSGIDGPGSDIPLVLPQFPISPGRSAVRFSKEFNEKRVEGDPNESKRTRALRVITTVGTVNKDKDNRPGFKGVTVSFREKRESDSETYEQLHYEQTWLPGKPWWSSAVWHTSPAGADVWEYALVGRSDASSCNGDTRPEK